jgi:hypothetical protein
MPATPRPQVGYDAGARAARSATPKASEREASLRYAEGVRQQSPGSRSAPWVRGSAVSRQPQRGCTDGCGKRPVYNPFGVDACCRDPAPRVRFATLGFVVQPLRG